MQRITSSVKQRLALPQRFTHYPHEPIRDNRHLWYSVRYILTQQRHHGLPPDQTLDGTNLPDLLGLRLIGAYTLEHLRQWLPRLRRAQLIEWLGVDELRAADGPVDGVVEAALAAAALDDLRISSPQVLAARRAILEITRGSLRPEELTALLGIRSKTLTRLERRPVDHALVHAVRLQLGARADLRARIDAWNAGETG